MFEIHLILLDLLLADYENKTVNLNEQLKEQQSYLKSICYYREYSISLFWEIRPFKPIHAIICVYLEWREKTCLWYFKSYHYAVKWNTQFDHLIKITNFKQTKKFKKRY